MSRLRHTRRAVGDELQTPWIGSAKSGTAAWVDTITQTSLIIDDPCAHPPYPYAFDLVILVNLLFVYPLSRRPFWVFKLYDRAAITKNPANLGSAARIRQSLPLSFVVSSIA